MEAHCCASHRKHCEKKFSGHNGTDFSPNCCGRNGCYSLHLFASGDYGGALSHECFNRTGQEMRNAYALWASKLAAASGKDKRISSLSP
ncbi:hypothetical protein NPIL_634571 [Nephila pilipes]|uniref:Uncharacterized protein n=1 Tax=Nephila pilipes TaxID=299642 RepID=A0A8X6T930_NEPPI|nr:hypothetical protein NPIL_634571 [Nephila pilipes]